jgi:hypothetical protein
MRRDTSSKKRRSVSTNGRPQGRTTLRLRPALDRVFGSDATTEVSTSGPYHLWRGTHSIQAPTMLEAAEGVIRTAREARDAAGIHPGQAVGFSSQLRDLTHPVELVLPPETSPG